MPPAAYLDSRLHLRLDAFSPKQLDAVRALFTHDNPEFKRWRAYRYTEFPPKEFVATWKQSGGYLHLPRGRERHVIEALGDHDLYGTLVIDDRRVFWPDIEDFELKGLEARDYQNRLVNIALERQTCLWRAPTGSGKTEAAFQFIQRAGTSALVVVPNRALLDQWVARVRSRFGFNPGVVGVGKSVIAPITVGIQASVLNRVQELAPLFGALICDEVQLFAAKTFDAIVDAMPARYRLGVSNSEQRADGKEYLIYDQFGELLPEATISRDEVLSAGKIVDVGVRLVPTDFRLDWYSQLPPDEKFKRRSELLEAMANDENRNALAVSCAKWCLDEGEQVAVLSDRREHCRQLDALITQLCRTGQLLGGQESRETFKDTVRRFAAGDVRAVVGTFQAIGVGFESHARLARGVFTTPVATAETARMQFMQYLGRFARSAPSKRDAWVYLLFDPHVHGDRPVRLVRKWVTQCQVYDPATGLFRPASEYLKEWKREKAKRRVEEQPADHQPEDDLFRSAQRRRSRA